MDAAKRAEAHNSQKDNKFGEFSPNFSILSFDFVSLLRNFINLKFDTNCL